MAPQIQGPPSRWDDRCKYFYRKLVGFNSQPLIDKLDECIDMHHGQKPINPPYTADDIARMAIVITHILEAERNLDLKLAKADYDWLEKEVEKEIARS